MLTSFSVYTSRSSFKLVLISPLLVQMVLLPVPYMSIRYRISYKYIAKITLNKIITKHARISTPKSFCCVFE